MIPQTEPRITIGLIENAATVGFELQGTFMLDGKALPAGTYHATYSAPAVALADASGAEQARGQQLELLAAGNESSFTLHNISIGRDFHWERLQNQRFQGDLLLATCGGRGLSAINRIDLEAYLASVISSEMNPASDPAFLKAHCVISRSWLLAQLELKRSALDSALPEDRAFTDAAAHRYFDVCNDDHCQRYHGMARVNAAAQQALADTRGQVLVFDGAICDTRFSKCCGGITERFSACWQDIDFGYLRPIADCPQESEGIPPTVGSEADARKFILSSPKAFCNVVDRELLSRVLPDFDCETQEFFRWTVTLAQEELQALLLKKTGIAFGAITSMTALARGDSGRMYELKITGTKAEKIIGKELAIRRALSPTHLYSSAFIVEAEGEKNSVPETFILRGAGWGHGVGLCQIGAAAMAAQGYTYRDILSHYFRGAELKTIYP